MRRLVFCSTVLLVSLFCVSSFSQPIRGLNTQPTARFRTREEVLRQQYQQYGKGPGSSPEIRSQTYVDLQRAHVAQIKKQIHALARRYEQSFLNPDMTSEQRTLAHQALRKANRGYREAVQKLQQAEDDVRKGRRARSEKLEERHENRQRIEQLDSHRDLVQRTRSQYEYWDRAFRDAAQRARRTQGLGPEVVAARAHVEAARVKKNYWEQAWKRSQNVYEDLSKRSRL